MRGLAAALVLLVGSPAAAEPEVSLGGEMRSILLLRTDSDFDPSERWYDPDGQTEGQAATFLRADVGLELTGHVSAFYQAELGWNAWSRNDPDQWFPAAESYPVLKHRELWSRWSRRDGCRTCWPSSSGTSLIRRLRAATCKAFGSSLAS